VRTSSRRSRRESGGARGDAKACGGSTLTSTSQAQTRAAAVESLGAQHGGVDIVVHNAGITRDKTLANMTAEQWDQVSSVNFERSRVSTRRSTPCCARQAGSSAFVPERHRGELRAEQLRDDQGGADRLRCGARRAGAARNHHRGRPWLHRDAHDRGDSVHEPRGRPATDPLRQGGLPRDVPKRSASSFRRARTA
jgi:NAD(P)-dependent dehydrogenase (short-subunit alcohol dehydrogenase family)